MSTSNSRFVLYLIVLVAVVRAQRTPLCQRYPYLSFCQNATPPPTTTTTQAAGSVDCNFLKSVCGFGRWSSALCNTYQRDCVTTTPPTTTPPGAGGTGSPYYCEDNGLKFSDNCLASYIQSTHKQFCPEYVRFCIAPQQPCVIKEMMLNGVGGSEDRCFDSRSPASQTQQPLCDAQLTKFRQHCVAQNAINVDFVRFCVLFADVCNQQLVSSFGGGGIP